MKILILKYLKLKVITHRNVKRYEEIRTLTTRQAEDCTTGCLLNYDYINDHIRLIAVDLSR